MKSKTVKAKRKAPSKKGKTWASRPSIKLPIPAYPITPIESLSLGFRMQMLSISEESSGISGSVTTGAGCGNDYIIMEFATPKQQHSVVIRGRELLKAWVQTIDPDEAQRIPS